MNNEIKETKKKSGYLMIPFEQLKVIKEKFQSNKNKGDKIGWRRAVMLYGTIFGYQTKTKVGFGRYRKKDVYDWFGEKLEEPKPEIAIGSLIRASLVTWGLSEYEGKKVHCLQTTYLNKKLGINNHAKYEYKTLFRAESNATENQKQQEKTATPNKIRKQLRLNYPNRWEWAMSEIKYLGNGLISVKGIVMSDGNCEFYNFDNNCRMYIPNNDYLTPNDCVVPRDALPRPTPTAIWSDEHKMWIENGEGWNGEKWIEIDWGTSCDDDLDF